MSVVARFYVQQVETFPNSPTASVVKMGAVCRGSANKTWASATPAGFIQMTIKNDAATAQFEQGCEYEVTFRRVEKPGPGDGHQPAPEYAGWETANEASGMAPNTCGNCGVVGSLPVGRKWGQPFTAEELDWSAHHAMYDEGGSLEAMQAVVARLQAAHRAHVDRLNAEFDARRAAERRSEA